MANYEYKLLHGSPTGALLMPWASQAQRDAAGPGSFEKKLNKLGEDGWEIISCSTTSDFLCFNLQATVVLRREKRTQ